MNEPTLPVLLAEFLLKSAIIIALGFAVSSILKKAPPAARHSLWFQVFIGSLVIPLLLIAIPRWQIIPTFEKPTSEVSLTTDTESQVIFSNPGESIPLEQLPPIPGKSLSFADWLSIAWLSGVILLSLQSLIGLAILIGINRRASQPSKECRQAFERIKQSVNCQPNSRLFVSSDITSPFTWGIFRPTILLPAKADQWSQQDLEMILLHELSHIQRRDAIAVLVSRLFLSLNWINPFAWLAIRQSVQVREADCDLKVLRHGHSAQNYAEMLFNQAKILSNHPARHCATAVAENGTIEQRIKMILDTKSKYSTQMIYTKTATAILVASIFIIGVIGNDDKNATPEKANANPLETKLRDIRIPSIELKDTPLEDAIRFLHQKSIETDPNPDAKSKGINIVIAQGVNRKTPINLKLTNVPIGEAIRYISALAGASHRVDVHAVVIEDAIKKVKSVTPTHAEAVKIAVNQQKLDTILLPSLEFNETSLVDALQFLQQKSVELDIKEDDRDKKGINVILNTIKDFNAKEIKLNLKLTNVPLGSAFKYTCEIAGCEYKVESHAVIIKPKIK